MRNLFISLLVFVGIFSFSFVGAQEIEIDFFYSKTCPHCLRANNFLDKLDRTAPDVAVSKHLLDSEESYDLLLEFYDRHGVPRPEQVAVPVIFVDSHYFLGFSDRIAEEIESYVFDLVPPPKERTVDLPIIGEVSLLEFSLPVTAVLLGALDGFNVCSLGALVLVLSLVLSLRSRKKMLLFGGAFILTTAVVYGFLIFFWYRLFDTLGHYLDDLEKVIGVLAIAGAAYFFIQFIKAVKRGASCESKPGEKAASKFSSKFQEIIEAKRSFLVVLGAVLAFALVITVVEFPCSAFVPVAFSAVLADAGVSGFAYLFYISLFVVFYLLDEIIIFAIALFTKKVWFGSEKATKWVSLIEAVILLAMGLYYLLGVAG